MVEYGSIPTRTSQKFVCNPTNWPLATSSEWSAGYPSGYYNHAFVFTGLPVSGGDTVKIYGELYCSWCNHWYAAPQSIRVLYGPVADADGPYNGVTGFPVQLDGTGSYHTDPGGTHWITTYEWDCSYDGITFNVDTTGSYPTYTWTSAGTYTVALRVTDDQGLTDIDVTRATIIDNTPPTADANGPYTINEGQTVTLDGSASSDPQGDTLEYQWDIDGDGIYDTGWSDSPYHTTSVYSDDWSTNVGLMVREKFTTQQFTDTDSSTLTVMNLAPTFRQVYARMDVEIGLRITGEKWHNVEASIMEGGREIAVLEVERWPGDPKQWPNTATVMASLDMTQTHTVTVTYDPYADVGDAILGDQPINGQLNGANPVWLTISSQGRVVSELKHTFNVQQSLLKNSNHWNHVEPWIVNLDPELIGVPMTLYASEMDRGSDDIGFLWSFLAPTVNWYNNDGTTGTSSTDPYPSYWFGTFPYFAADTQTMAYTGPTTISLTNYDDDGGFVSTTIVIV
jgi:hypothetical protein